ncbi:MAG: methyltransferase domain-containing protein [Deltaproteobacteria bacterium]|nr:MAG: methyltransferase domain-containing protein [Deltaproteobacteria bacterium]
MSPPSEASVASSTLGIASYFDETVQFYRVFWHGNTGALHFGMGCRAAGTHQQRLLNTNRVLADAIDVLPGERVLDAGCGVGGSALWLATHRRARVVGVTVSAAQVRIARAAAADAGLADAVEFMHEDFTRTTLPDANFDVVWALESSCYAADKDAFLAEMGRVLRPGGRFVMADGFLGRAPGSRREERLYETFKRGLVLPDLPTADRFAAAMRRHGFVDVRAARHDRDVTASCRRLFWHCLLTYPLARAGRALGVVSTTLLANSRAGIAAYVLLRRGIAEYAVIVARKPSPGDATRGDPRPA